MSESDLGGGGGCFYHLKLALSLFQSMTFNKAKSKLGFPLEHICFLYLNQRGQRDQFQVQCCVLSGWLLKWELDRGYLGSQLLPGVCPFSSTLDAAVEEDCLPTILCPQLAAFTLGAV